MTADPGRADEPPFSSRYREMWRDLNAIEPPSISELARIAEEALRDYLVAKSQALQAEGCCSSDTWRGHLCEYHQGYADGIDELLEVHRAVGLNRHP